MYFYGIVVFLLGLSVGSFLNAYTRRALRGEKVLGRSKCESCKHVLAITDLVPVLSFLFLRGKCRYCSSRLSFQYPLVETITGVLFILVFFSRVYPYIGGDIALLILNFIFWLAITSILISLAITDILEYVLIEKVLYLGISLTLIYHLLFKAIPLTRLYFTLKNDVSGLGGYILKTDFLSNRVQSVFLGLNPLNLDAFLWSLAAGVLVFLFFLLLRTLTRGRGLGEGDLYLGFMVGVLTGVPGVLAALFSSYILGSVFTVGLIVNRKKKLGEVVPFGPFLVAGTIIAILYGDSLLGWYLGRFGGY